MQRRLASSPEAIYQSLKRRREKLQKRLREEELQRGFSAEINFMSLVDMEDIDDELEDIAADELEKTEEALADRATAALTVAELHMEIDQLENLEKLALAVRRSGRDRKWEELSNLLQDQQMFERSGSRRKLVIFTEHRDTLNYLADRISSLLSNADSVVAIHGGMGREDRKKAETAFKQDAKVHVLLATDAAGEGINLQRAHLMVNYDLPWNVNRLEQRFGRIHRIGQTEVCRLCGASPRYYKNQLVFLAADHTKLDNLTKHIAQYLAWESIVKDKTILNLDHRQSQQATAKLNQSDQDVLGVLNEAYQWLIVPLQPDPQGGLQWKFIRIQTGSDTLVQRASKKLVHEEYLIVKYSSTRLFLEALRPYFWPNTTHVDLKKLWEFSSQYLYLPRLKNPDVLLQSIKDGIASTILDSFAYAEGYDETA